MSTTLIEGFDITRNGTNGDFYLMVSRVSNTTTASTYSLQYHCENAAGRGTGAIEELDVIDTPYFLQDQ